MPLSASQLKELARHGAAARIKELETEIASIRSAFPETHGRTRKRGHISAAARKAVSIRMKKYWAAKRAAKK